MFENCMLEKIQILKLHQFRIAVSSENGCPVSMYFFHLVSTWNFQALSWSDINYKS